MAIRVVLKFLAPAVCLSISAGAWGIGIAYMANRFCRSFCEECRARAREEYAQAPSASTEAALYMCCIHEQAYSDLIIRAVDQKEMIQAFRCAARLLLRSEVRRRLGVTLQHRIEGFVQQSVDTGWIAADVCNNLVLQCHPRRHRVDRFVRFEI